MAHTVIRPDWNIVNGSVDVAEAVRLPLSGEHPVRSCPCCEQLFSCARVMHPWETKVNDESRVIYQCEYDKCEFVCPADWADGTAEYQALVSERVEWSRNQLIEKGKEFPGKYTLR